MLRKWNAAAMENTENESVILVGKSEWERPPCETKV
jgi:hypothetical protein